MARHERVAFFNYGPGLVRTKVSMPQPLMRILLEGVGRLFSRSAEEAAADAAELLLGDHPSGFYGPGLEYRGVIPATDDPGLSAGLWDYCQELASTAHSPARHEAGA